MTLQWDYDETKRLNYLTLEVNVNLVDHKKETNLAGVMARRSAITLPGYLCNQPSGFRIGRELFESREEQE